VDGGQCGDDACPGSRRASAGVADSRSKADGIDGMFGDVSETLQRIAAGQDRPDLLERIEAGLALLYEESRRRERWLVAVGEITTALLAGDATDLVLPMIASRARELAAADCAMVLVPAGSASPGSLVVAAVAAVERLRSRVLLGALVPIAGSVSGRVFRDGVSMQVDDMATTSPPAAMPGAEFGPAVAVPLACKGATLGALMALRIGGAQPFLAEAAEVTESFASQAALALHLAESRRAERRVALLEDRERIAVHLQDNLIQRLFATGMLVDSVSRRVDSAELREKLDRATHDLDVTIRQTRETIQALQLPADPDHPELRRRLLAAIEEATAATSLSPSVHLDGPLNALVPAAIADRAVEVVREALSDVVRNGATNISVSVVASDALAVVVADDVPTVPEGEWLRELSDRAVEFGGHLTVAPKDGVGRRLVWQVPLG
jgi:signal transduction histidine kinase